MYVFVFDRSVLYNAASVALLNKPTAQSKQYSQKMVQQGRQNADQYIPILSWSVSSTSDFDAESIRLV